MSNVGYVYSGADKGKGEDFLTWSDKDGYRIWIHSKASGSSREIVSVELQAIGTNSFKPSKEELAMRLKLCVRTKLPKENDFFKATMFRTLPTGQLLEEHAHVISRVQNQANTGGKKIQLVEEISSKNIDLKRRFVWDTGEEILREGGKSKDAILIAKVYEMLQSSGTRKLSARTAELLGLEVSVVHTAVQVARRNGWLTSNGVGLSGGVLTEKGNEKFLAIRGPERLARFINTKEG